jgi:hypothetical protein
VACSARSRLVSLRLAPFLAVLLMPLSLFPAIAADFNGVSKEPEAEPVVVPFQVINHIPFVEVRAGGRKWMFVLDTGAARCVVGEEFALEVVGRTSDPTLSDANVRGAAGDLKKLSVVVAPVLWAGPKPFINVETIVQDFSQFRSAGRPVDGILGFDLFRNTRWTIDYSGKQLRLAPLEGPPLPEATSLTYTVREGMPHLNVACQDQRMDFVIDTGSGGGFEVPAGRREFEFIYGPRPGSVMVTANGARPSRIGRLAGSIKLAGLEFVEPTVTGMPEALAFLGGQVLENYAITFDPKRSEVQLLPNRTEPVHLPAIRSLGIVFDRATEPWRILQVLDDTPAKGLPIETGDGCVQINGEPLAKWPRERYDREIDRAATMRLRLARGGMEFEVTVPISTLVP